MRSSTNEAIELLDWIAARRVHECFDDAGRPLGEGRAAAFQRVETDMQLCPYPGSRYRHAKPMNATALRQMPPWRELLTMLSGLSQRHCAKRGGEFMTIDDLAWITGSGVFLADFLVLRRRNPLPSGRIPVLISGLYKLCLGFQLAYLPERYSGLPPSPLPDGEGFHAYLEENELLIGESEVCGGSPAMILQAYQAITAASAVPQAALTAACASLDIDWDRFDAFAENAAMMWNDLMLYLLRSPAFVPRLSDAWIPPALRDRLNASLERHGEQILAGQSGLVADVARALRAHCPTTASVLDIAPAPAKEPCALARVVLRWLVGQAGEDLGDFEPAISSDLEARLVTYETYVAQVLGALERRLGAMMRALGREDGEIALTPSALSGVCGRTLHDWDAPPS